LTSIQLLAATIIFFEPLHQTGLVGLFGFITVLSLFITGIIYVKPKDINTSSNEGAVNY